MLLLFPGPSPAAGEEKDVGDRSTTFQPVQGGTEHRSGEALLVSAYAGLWLLLLGWVLLQWTKQTALARRIGELEGAVAKADRGASASKEPAGAAAKPAPALSSD
jgi:hypothetical protein